VRAYSSGPLKRREVRKTPVKVQGGKVQLARELFCLRRDVDKWDSRSDWKMSPFCSLKNIYSPYNYVREL